MSERMLAANWRALDDLRVEEVPRPAPGPGQVLVRVAACGLCATDLHVLDGSIPLYRPPRILGHETAGIVAELGPGVRALQVGDPVALDTTVSCGVCTHCREGRTFHCGDRTSYIGGWAEYVLVPEQIAYRLPAGLPVHLGALAEPLSCVVHAVKTAQLQAGDTVAIVGAGAVGLLLLQLARRSGASRVLVSEPDPDRRALARRLGADLAVDPTAEDLRAKALDLSGGLGVDVAFEAVGSARTVADAVSLPRRGGTVVVVGVAPGDATLSLRLYDLWERELAIKQAFIRNLGDFRRAVELLAVLDVEPLVTHRFPLGAIHAALEAARSRRGIKVQVVPTER